MFPRDALRSVMWELRCEIGNCSWLGSDDPLGCGLGKSGISRNAWDLWGRYHMDLKVESGVCSESIVGGDKGLKSCTVGWERGLHWGLLCWWTKAFLAESHALFEIP